jgi:hypothetical protein
MRTAILGRTLTAGVVLALVAIAAAARAPSAQQNTDLGYTDTPMLPGQPWRVHDPTRPHPRVVRPGRAPGDAPSDAVVLFDGTNLSKWGHPGQGASADRATSDARWIVRDGYFEVRPGAGTLITRDSFGDVQLHLEWAAPAEVRGRSQGRGNSGVFLMGLYEVQLLDSFDNPTYADGQAGAIYGQYPPLANAARPPGDWQTYDIVFEAPRFEGSRLVRPAFVTLVWNGVVVHNRKQAMGPTVHRVLPEYAPHAAELPLALQDHGNPVRFRNVWVRRLADLVR